MRKLIYLLLGLVVATSAVGRAADENRNTVITEKPDLEKIKAETTDPKSRFYYPRLMERYERNETIMGLEDYRYLYLGTMFQEDYNPYRTSEFRDKNRELYYKENLSRPELDSIIAYAELSLEDDPFDLEQMSYLIYALRQRDKKNRANVWQYRLNHVLLAIISTGTGLDEENAWFVINPRHEYNIANFLGRAVESEEFIEPYYEYIKLAPVADLQSKSPDGYYFNIRQMLEEYYRKYPEELSN